MKNSSAPRPPSVFNLQHVTWGLVLILVCLAVAIIILGSVPPVDRDSLSHHLYVPRLYLEHGGMVELPEVEFSYFPMNLELLYLLPLAFGNDIVPKYIHFFFALLSALIIYRFLKISLNNLYALTGSIFFLSIPVVIKLSTVAYVDLGLIFFSTASLFLLLKWAKNTDKIYSLILAGICSGLAVGTKYNGLITLIILTLLVPILYQQCCSQEKRSNILAAGHGILFLIISLFIYSPWAIRNITWTGNPFYPLFGSIFGTNDSAVLGGMNFFLIRKFLYHESWWETLLIPFRIFFQGQDDNPQYFDGQLNPALLLFPLFAFNKSTDTRQGTIEKISLISFAFLYILLAFFQRDLRIRYIGPALVPLVSLSVFGLKNLIDTIGALPQSVLRRLSSYCLCFAVAVTFLLNFQYLIKMFITVQPFSFLSNSMTREEYITHFRPEFPVFQYANNHLTKNNKILCVFAGNRGYFLKIDHLFDFKNNESYIFNMIENHKNNNAIIHQLRKKQITHIILREDLWLKWLKNKIPTNNQYIFTNFFSESTQEIYRNENYILLRLLPL